jgi:hypothetical protein
VVVVAGIQAAAWQVAEGEPATPKKKKAHRARQDHEQPTVT